MKARPVGRFMFTLSDYLPKNTEYFYSYPIGDTFYHYNSGDPLSEELISARLLVCAGKNVKVVVYHSIVKNKLLELLEKNSDIPFLSKDKIIILPASINDEVLGTERNELITEALIKQTSSKNLIMAQPILDDRLMEDYQIDPKLSIWLNDKKNLDQYVPSEFLPKRYVQFANGQEFFNSTVKVPIPCVVKISSSSTGDGVRICSSVEDLEKSKKDFAERSGTIFIEEYISYTHNLGFQLGIPFDKNKSPHVIGYNHQVTDVNGVFLGGFIYKGEKDEKIEKIKIFIETKILPKIQSMGWYGIGGLDILLDAHGKFYIIDSNFRTTGMTAYVFLTKNNQIPKSMISFSATFHGTEKEFTTKVLSLNHGKDKKLTIISVIKKDDEYIFNGALLFDKKEELPNLARTLTEKGIQSEVLKVLETSC